MALSWKLTLYISKLNPQFDYYFHQWSFCWPLMAYIVRFSCVIYVCMSYLLTFRRIQTMKHRPTVSIPHLGWVECVLNDDSRSIQDRTALINLLGSIEIIIFWRIRRKDEAALGRLLFCYCCCCYANSNQWTTFRYMCFPLKSENMNHTVWCRLS